MILFEDWNIKTGFKVVFIIETLQDKSHIIGKVK